MTLHNDYLKLLQRYGLEPLVDNKSTYDQLEMLRRVSKKGNLAERMRANEVLEMINALDTLHDGKLSPILEQMNNNSGGNPFEEDINSIKIALSKENALFIDKIYFNEFPTGDFNASARKTSNGYLCLLNTGLLRLLKNSAYACCHVIRQAEDGSLLYAGNDMIDKELTRERASLYMLVRVVVNYLKHQQHPHPLAANLPMQPWGTIAAGALSAAMSNFVLCHEFGHVILSHNEKKNVRLSLTPHGKLASIAKSHQEEFSADRWSSEILLKMDLSEDQSFIPKISGGFCFLTLHLIVLEIQAKMQGNMHRNDADSESHPSSVLRIEKLKKWLSKSIDSKLEQQVMWFWMLLNRLLALVEESSFEINEDGIRFTGIH